MKRKVKVVIEKQPDGYVARAVGVRGVVVGQGRTAAEALADVESALKFHVETFGPESLEDRQNDPSENS